jgi:hypothetical protein
MPSAERNKKRKKSELEKSAQSCKKLADMFKRDDPCSTQNAEICTIVQADEAAQVQDLGNGSKPTVPLDPLIEFESQVTDVGAHTYTDLSDNRDNANAGIKPDESQAGLLRKTGNEVYMGVKLNLASLLETYSDLVSFTAMKDLRSRIHVKCKVCEEYIKEAQKFSKKGSVPIAHGVRADGVDRLKLIVEHINSEIHSAAKKREQLDVHWEKGSDKHPWLKVLKSHNASVVTFLVRLAFDVYNDSLYETLSAYSWLASSLTTMAATGVPVGKNKFQDAIFIKFQDNFRTFSG